jgi:hypothetical protein
MKGLEREELGGKGFKREGVKILQYFSIRA